MRPFWTGCGRRSERVSLQPVPPKRPSQHTTPSRPIAPTVLSGFSQSGGSALGATWVKADVASAPSTDDRCQFAARSADARRDHCPVKVSDAAELIAANLGSRDHHASWASPFTDAQGFDAWFGRTLTGPNCGLGTGSPSGLCVASTFKRRGPRPSISTSLVLGATTRDRHEYQRNAPGPPLNLQNLRWTFAGWIMTEVAGSGRSALLQETQRSGPFSVAAVAPHSPRLDQERTAHRPVGLRLRDDRTSRLRPQTGCPQRDRCA